MTLLQFISGQDGTWGNGQKGELPEELMFAATRGALWATENSLVKTDSLYQDECTLTSQSEERQKCRQNRWLLSTQ